MENSIIICSDIHCRNFWKKVLDIKDKKIVFLGDYLDPYPSEGFSFENGLVNLESIIDFKKQNLERVTLLLGNHDFNALWKKNWASRHNYTFQNESHSLYAENLSLFEPYKVIDNILFTHAGISKGWADTYNISDPIKHMDKDWNSFLQNPFDESYLSIFDCGIARWGNAPYGGPLWSDFNDEFVDPDWDLWQVFGHTQGKITGSIRQKGNAHCLDSRAVFEYDLNTHTVELSELTENYEKIKEELDKLYNLYGES